MGLYDRQYTQYHDEPPQFGGGASEKPAWLIIIGITVVAFLLNALFFARGDDLKNWMSVGPETLFQPWLWWQWVTYAFAHESSGISHIFFNMLGLFFFGSAVERRLGRAEFVRFYLVAAVVGGIVHSVTMLIVGGPGVIGASGSVMACVILFCFLYPHANILLMMVFPIKAWVAGVMFAVLDLAGALSGTGNTAFNVHLAGMAFAALYHLGGWNLRFLDPTRWAAGGGPRLPRRGPRLRVHDPERKLAKEAAEADRILQKIHDSGEASLTNAERRTLERYSRRVRGKG
jgi:membrane associated rhomboid family serine protease